MKSYTCEKTPDHRGPDMKDAFRIAESAADLEKKKDFGEAARQWWLAAEVARSPHQQHWCACRASLCERYHKAPVSQST